MRSVGDDIQDIRDRLREVRRTQLPSAAKKLASISDQNVELLLGKFMQRAADATWLAKLCGMVEEKLFGAFESVSVISCGQCKSVLKDSGSAIEAFNTLVVFKARTFLEVLAVKAATTASARLIVGNTNPFEKEEDILPLKLSCCGHSLAKQNNQVVQNVDTAEFLAFSVLKSGPGYAVGFLCFLVHLRLAGVTEVSDLNKLDGFFELEGGALEAKSAGKSTNVSKTSNPLIQKPKVDVDDSVFSYSETHSARTDRSFFSAKESPRLLDTSDFRDNKTCYQYDRPTVTDFAKKVMFQKSPEVGTTGVRPSQDVSPTSNKMYPTHPRVDAVLREFSKLSDINFFPLGLKNTTMVNFPALSIPPDTQQNFFLKHAGAIFGNGLHLNAILMALQQLFRGCKPEFNFKRNVEATPLDFLFNDKSVLSVAQGALRGNDPLRVKTFLALLFLTLVAPDFMSELARYIRNPDEYFMEVSQHSRKSVVTHKGITDPNLLTIFASRGVHLRKFTAEVTSSLVNSAPLSEKQLLMVQNNPVSFLKEYLDTQGLMPPLANNIVANGTTKVYEAQYQDKTEAKCLRFGVVFDTSINKTVTFKMLSIAILSILFEHIDFQGMAF